MTNLEKVKNVRDITMSSFCDINRALKASNGDVEQAIAALVKQKQADNNDMANRIANNGIVYSYVHNNKIGAMIVLSCQTDFAAKNELFINLAKNICMHIVSTPVEPRWIDEKSIPADVIADRKRMYAVYANGKPSQIAEKIIEGKLQKDYERECLLNQMFVKYDEISIRQMIQSVATTIGEKIEVKKFVKMSNTLGFIHEGDCK